MRSTLLIAALAGVSYAVQVKSGIREPAPDMHDVPQHHDDGENCERHGLDEFCDGQWMEPEPGTVREDVTGMHYEYAPFHYEDMSWHAW